MKIKLKGEREAGNVWLNGKPLSPDRSLKIVNHSPTGFSWGYGGSGPSQLALAILLELYDQEYALKRYQDFKWYAISRLPQTDIDVEIDMTAFETSGSLKC